MSELSDQSLIEYKQYEDWVFKLYPLDITATGFVDFTSIIELYRSKIKQKLMPSWSNMDFYDFKGWHGWVAILERDKKQNDLKYRLFGSKLKQCYGFDATNKYLSELTLLPNQFKNKIVEFSKKVTETPAIGHSYGHNSWTPHLNTKFSSLYLPLAEDEITADKILQVTIIKHSH